MNTRRRRAPKATTNSISIKEDDSMLTQEDLLQELEEMGVGPGEITIPYR